MSGGEGQKKTCCQEIKKKKIEEEVEFARWITVIDFYSLSTSHHNHYSI